MELVIRRSPIHEINHAANRVVDFLLVAADVNRGDRVVGVGGTAMLTCTPVGISAVELLCEIRSLT